MSLEELMDIEITSVSKQPQKLSNAAAAIYVITSEDIRRSGARAVPELLRMVPGLFVARIDSNKWAVSSRGFSSRLSNKMLVLLDGRSIYSPLFSGVYWELYDIPLDDIERIEVIRGPGATLWGANAVNGVINIITKQAKDTQGAQVVAGTGTYDRGFGSVRYGDNIGEDIYFRLTNQYDYRDQLKLADGSDAKDEWDNNRTSFRLDWTPNENDTVTTLADAYVGNAYTTAIFPTFDPPYEHYSDFEDYFKGGSILTRWEHTVDVTSDWMLQLYYDYSERQSFAFEEHRHIADIEFQHRFEPMENHHVIWGLGYRFSGDQLTNSDRAMFLPDERDVHLFNVFVQDEIELMEDKLKLTLGTKLEHNDFTGFEVQPNARLAWTPLPKHVLWGAVSRAVRTPSRAESDASIFTGVIPPHSKFNAFDLPILLRFKGNNDLDAEDLLAYEIGYRYLAADWVHFDLSAFYNSYDDLLSTSLAGIELRQDQDRTYFYAPLQFDNSMTGETYGVELSADFQPLPSWRLKVSYSYLDVQLHSLSPDFIDALEEYENRSPHHQVSLLSYYDITPEWELDIWARFVGDLNDTFLEPVKWFKTKSYVSVDVRLGWHPTDKLEFTAGFQNLLDDRRHEFSQTLLRTLPSEVERSAYIMVNWTF